MKQQISKITSALSASVAGLSAMTGTALAQGIGEDVNIQPGRGFASSVSGLINGVLSFVMVIAALLVFLYLIMGGIEWITSGGDKSKTESARNKITGAVIGLIVLAASYAILLIVLNFLGFRNLGEVFDNVRPINR